MSRFQVDATAQTTAVHATGPARFHNLTVRIVLRGARAAYLGPGMNLAPHRNAVATVALSLREPFDLTLAGRSGALEGYARRSSAHIPPGAWHHLKTYGPMAFVYLDALSEDVQTLAAREIAPLSEHEVAYLTAQGHKGMATLLTHVLGEPSVAAVTPDARIAQLVQEINRAPDAVATLAQAAAVVGLSPSRCQYLLRSALGMPFRRYRLWRRMAWVIRALAGGATLTEAAYASGFSSSAHLSAAFKAMFGLAPSALQAPGVIFDLD